MKSEVTPVKAGIQGGSAVSIETTETTANDLDWALEQLALQNRKFPEKALRIVQAQREAAIPRLIEAIEQATANAATGVIVKGGITLFALHLLTEFQAKEAWPAIRKAISLPGNAPYDLFTDVISETLPGIIAQFNADSPATIEELIGDQKLNQFVRWSAAGSFLHLVRSGKMTRVDAVHRLRKALKAAVQNNDYKGIDPVLMELYNFAPTEAESEIREAYARNLVGDMATTLEDFEDSFQGGRQWFQESLEECKPTEIADTVEELRGWNWPGDKEPVPSLEAPSPGEIDSVTASPASQDSSPPIPVQVVHDTPRVGRNDPCPCGSGKKFKKCCGNN
jgi:hypothetical protein